MSDVAAAWRRSVVIVGAGIKVPDQLTLEAMDVLKNASEIWTNLPEPEYARLAESIGQEPRSLWPFFQADRPRLENYRAVVQHLIDRAQELPDLVYLTQGHPFVLDRVTTELIRQCEDADLPVSVLPGLSCIDTILAEIRYEPARGLQIHDATTFVARQLTPDARAGLLLLQPGVFGIDKPRRTSSTSAPDLTALCDALCRTYQPDHPAILVRSATASMAYRQFRTTVAGLSSVAPAMLLWSTLWLPPLDDIEP